MGHKCYISFKTEDENYKKDIQQWCDMDKVDMIDKSLNDPIESEDEDYIMRKIREDYLSDSTVTIFLIGQYSSENQGEYEQRYIKRELQASLYNGKNNSRNGILGVVLPSMYDCIYKGIETCTTCGDTHSIVNINNRTTIKEFHRNYYLDNKHGCFYAEEDRFCVLVKWDDFKKHPNEYINQAFDKRTQPIANKVIVRPK
ncbi:MAG: TIR domain-containing protein [Alistipes senegalensis]|nr:TIR domain-containing protein [Bacteroides cellulosilyticus]MCM1352931.1 TIR domain-containing protein [Alistipes senegalensis]